MRFEIRPAVAADIDEIAQVHVLGWRATYRGILPDSLLDNLDVSQRAKLWAEWLDGPGVNTVLAVGAAGVLGFVRLMPARPIAAPPIGAAEVTHLYVHPEKQGFGVGQALLMHSVQLARAASYRVVVLWVLEANASARLFYERFGFVHDGARRTDPALLGNEAAETRYVFALW